MKKLINLIFLFLVPIFLFSEEAVATNTTVNKSLMNSIDKIESMKKELLDVQEAITTVQSECVDKAITNILTEKEEITSKPYRIAELSEDGVTPLPFALERRQQSFEIQKKQHIENCEKEILELTKDNITKKEQLLRDINTLYGTLADVTLNTTDGELVVNYKSYDGQNFNWVFDVLIKNDNNQIENTAYISFETLTGKDPELYSYKDYDGFCDKVDYYDNLFRTELPNFNFTLTLQSLPSALESPSEYEIHFLNLVWHNDTNDISISLTNEAITYTSKPSYNLYNLFANTETTASLIDAEFESSRIVSLGFSNTYTLLPLGTKGSHGSDKQYINFGYYPQSMKKESVTIDEEAKENILGWECYKGSDGDYYTKQVCNDTAYMQGHQYEDYYHCYEGNEYYFKMEPIKWCVVNTKPNGNMVLVSDKVLDERQYYENDTEDSWGYTKSRLINEEKIYPICYEYSSMRAFLNGLNGSSYEVSDYTNQGFINKAFSNKASLKIIPTSIEDKSISDTGKTLKDKVFILSKEELESSDYNMSNYKEKALTDFAYVQAYKLYWITRTPINSSDAYMKQITSDGYYSDYSAHVENLRGIVPAITISK